MTTIDEKEILEIENLKAKLSKVFHDTQMDMKRFESKQRQYDKNFEMETSKKFYEALRLAFYGVAVGAGVTFAIAKTLQILGNGGN